MILQLLNHISTYHPLQPEARHAIEESFRQEVFSKGDTLLRQGSVCRKLYFVEFGALRGYYNLDEKEVTHWFAFENDFVTSFHSFITGRSAVENIQLLEGSVLWSVTREALDKLLNTFPDVERVLRIAYEKYYLRLEERYVNAQFTSAKDRYENLLRQSPHIIERISLGQVASYLGITQETLSRIRKGI